MSFNSIGVPMPRIEFGVGWEDGTGWDRVRDEYPPAHGWREFATVFNKKIENKVVRVKIFYRWKIQ